MFRILLFVVVAFVLGPMHSFAQEASERGGKVEIMQDEQITRLAEQYKKMNLRNPSFDGFRVQIFFDSGNNSKKRAADVLDEFVLKYPACRAFLSFKEPYYRVRVGNFRTLTEAVGFQKKIVASYPNAFPVKEKISFKELE
jgi:hypothetical protein